MEKRTKVDTYLVELICDKCGEGEMLPDGIAKPTSPMKYEHKCTKCGHTVDILGETYPRIERTPVKEQHTSDGGMTVSC